MNAWSSHEDAWWWALWTPGSMSSGPAAAATAPPAAGHADEAATQPSPAAHYGDTWLALNAAQALDSQATAQDYDKHSGWGTHAGTICPLVHCPEEMLEELMQLADVKAGVDCVLDIGCGDGR